MFFKRLTDQGPKKGLEDPRLSTMSDSIMTLNPSIGNMTDATIQVDPSLRNNICCFRMSCSLCTYGNIEA